MRLIPIPLEHLSVSAPYWLPFVEGIAKRQRCHLDQRLADITTGQVQLILIWDDNDQIAKALIGLQEMQRGDDKVARLVWVTGKDRHQWIGLLPDLEQWCREKGAKGMEAMARPGWFKELKRHGYRLTHVKLEKDF